jgi:O-antigen/teichoic acid export membrane protein
MTATIATGERHRAAHAALTLGTSFAMTLAIGLIVRLAVPRLLGPEGFGALRFAESYAEIVFVILTLGVDAQIRREAATAPAETREVLWGLVLIRAYGGIALILAGVGMLLWSGSGTGASTLFAVCAVAQVCSVLSNAFIAFEHAGDVRWVARAMIGFKVIWAVFAIGALAFVRTGMGFALAVLIAEAIRLQQIMVRSRRDHGMVLQANWPRTMAIIVTSLPFFFNYLAHSTYGRTGLWWLAAMAGDREAGLYGAASSIASIALLGMPLVTWVLVPSVAREGVQARNGGENLISSALRIALLGAVPVSVLSAIAAPAWVPLLFGRDYATAALALRILAPTFVLAYAATICAIALMQDGRVWVVTLVSASGLLLNAGLNAVLVPWAVDTGRSGDPAAAAAAATLLTECVVTAALLLLTMRGRASASLKRTVAGLALASTAACLVPVMMPLHLATGLALSITLFTAVAYLTRVVAPSDIELIRTFIQRRRSRASA